MSELNITPGEWLPVDVFVETDTGVGIVTGIGKAGHDHEMRANARLIAAAPELYQRLKELHEGMLFDSEYMTSQHCADIEKLLSACRGET